MNISVAMCTYNGERFLREQLASIALQTRLPQELVVCDDGSTDATIDILRNFSQSAPFAVKLIRNRETLGSTRNFENAIARCKGDIVALADQDDVWNSRKLAVLTDHLKANPQVGAIFSDADLLDDESNLLSKRLWQSIPFHPGKETLNSDEFRELLLRQDVVTGATLVFRSSLLSRILPIPNGWVHDAWIAWISVLYSSLAYSTEPLIQYRVHSGQQIGVASNSASLRLRKVQASGNHQYVSIERRFMALRDRMLVSPAAQCEMVVEQLDGKIQHASYQASLHANKAFRAVQIVKAWPRYRRYTRGLVTALRDLMA
jgi:glycosyltransferase involved in cell wall biosynthesis